MNLKKILTIETIIGLSLLLAMVTPNYNFRFKKTVNKRVKGIRKTSESLRLIKKVTLSSTPTTSVFSLNYLGKSIFYCTDFSFNVEDFYGNLIWSAPIDLNIANESSLDRIFLNKTNNIPCRLFPIVSDRKIIIYTTLGERLIEIATGGYEVHPLGIFEFKEEKSMAILWEEVERNDNNREPVYCLHLTDISNGRDRWKKYVGMNFSSADFIQFPWGIPGFLLIGSSKNRTTYASGISERNRNGFVVIDKFGNIMFSKFYEKPGVKIQTVLTDLDSDGKFDLVVTYWDFINLKEGGIEIFTLPDFCIVNEVHLNHAVINALPMDIDSDGNKELIAGSTEGALYIFNSDLSLKRVYSIPIDTMKFRNLFLFPYQVNNFDGDERNEVFCWAKAEIRNIKKRDNNGKYYEKGFFLYKPTQHKGTLTLNLEATYGFPIDLEDDGIFEIMFAKRDTLEVWGYE